MADNKTHFLIPVERAPAPHLVSGTPSDGPLRTLEQAIKSPIGNPGVAYAPACNPKLIPTHATGEAWALLTVVNGEAVVPPSACQACIDTDAWRDAYAKTPHWQVVEFERAKAELEASKKGCC